MNRLARERSPYLLQHAANPVDWYPWGDEALASARAEDKPIFLSIGYSTCHWCHVMEHESFVSDAIAGALNRRLRVDQGGPRGTARRRSRLHGVRAGHDRLGRLADDGLPDARPEAVLRRDLLSADVTLGQAGLPRSARRARTGLEGGSGARERGGRRAVRSAAARDGVTRRDRHGSRASRTTSRSTWPSSSSRWRSTRASRRIRRGAEVPAPRRSSCSCCANTRGGRRRPRRPGAAAHGHRNAARDGARRHARSHRRRVSPLLGRRGMAGAALREDAVRPGAARAGVSRGRAGVR